MEVGADARLVDQGPEERVADVDDLHAGQADPLHPGDLRRLDHQLAQLQAALRIPVVPHADTGHDHLRLALSDPPPDLIENRAGRTRPRGPAHGGDDAVRTVAVAAVLDLDEAPGAAGGRGRPG